MCSLTMRYIFYRQERQLNKSPITLEGSDLARETHSFLWNAVSRALNAAEKLGGDYEHCEHEYEIHRTMLSNMITNKE